MKKYIIQILTVLVVASLAACDFDITNPVGGGRGSGGGRDTMDIDTNYREPMLVDIHEGDVITTRDMKMISVNSVTVTSDRNFEVVLNVTDEKTGEQTIVTLSMENPVEEVNGCLISLLYIRPDSSEEESEEIKYVVGLQII